MVELVNERLMHNFRSERELFRRKSASSFLLVSDSTTASCTYTKAIAIRIPVIRSFLPIFRAIPSFSTNLHHPAATMPPILRFVTYPVQDGKRAAVDDLCRDELAPMLETQQGFLEMVIGKDEKDAMVIAMVFADMASLEEYKTNMREKLLDKLKPMLAGPPLYDLCAEIPDDKVPINNSSFRRTSAKFRVLGGSAPTPIEFDGHTVYPDRQCRHTSTDLQTASGPGSADSMIHMEWCPHHTTYYTGLDQCPQIQGGWVRFLRKEFNGRVRKYTNC